MRVLFLMLSIAFFSQKSWAQNTSTCNCDKELTFVFQELKESASYKTQKEVHATLATAYTNLQNELATPIPVFECFQKLNSFIHLLKDNHNEIYGNTESFSYQQLTDSIFLKNYVNSKAAHLFPTTTLNIDSLVTVLKDVPANAKEGIYSYKDYISVALYKVDKEYHGIVLQSKIPSWQVGERMITLVPTEENTNRYYHSTGKFIDKTMLMSSDTFINGTLPLFGWTKNSKTANFYNVPYADDTFLFKHINKQTAYLKLGSFSGSNKGKVAANNFYKTLPKNLNTTPNLIVDLRNNGGGSDKSSKPFLKYLQKYKGQCYILINFKTMSNAEQFVIQLKNNENVTILGDTSNGRVAYGRNKPVTKTTPSGYFKIHFTDMDSSEYLPYENKGVTPAIFLKPETSWIDQTLEYIANQ